MDFGYVILVVVLVGASAFATAMLPRYWRGHFPAFDRPQSWWAFGDEAWRAFRRTYVLGVVAAWLIAIGTAVLPYVPRRPRSRCRSRFHSVLACS